MRTPKCTANYDCLQQSNYGPRLLTFHSISSIVPTVSTCTDARKQMGKLVADHKQQLAERQTRQKRQCSGGDPWTKQPV
jgi:hypothetical protein